MGTLKVKLTGSLSTINIFLNGDELKLKPVNDDEFIRIIKGYKPKNNEIDLFGVIKGWHGIEWRLEIFYNDKLVYKRQGTLDAYQVFNEKIKI